MKLNALEKALMNNAGRAALQRLYDARLLQRLGGRVDGGRVLEVGCGRGVGVEIILERFGAAHVSAFDLDPDMVDRARSRLGRVGDRVALSVGDATAIEAPDGAFDAVFEFGILHHVPAWRDAVGEVRRVLRPGGRFFFQDVTRRALDRWPSKTFLEHPNDDRFSARQFVDELERQGLRVGDSYVTRVFDCFLFGVGTKPAA